LRLEPLQVWTKTFVATLAGVIKVHEEVDHFRRVVLLRSMAQFLRHAGKLQAFLFKELHVIVAPTLFFVNGRVSSKFLGHVHEMGGGSGNVIHLLRR
jgi:hypothetical protein